MLTYNLIKKTKFTTFLQQKFVFTLMIKGNKCYNLLTIYEQNNVTKH